MISPIATDNTANLPSAQAVGRKKILIMVKNDRMAGSIPKWIDAPEPQQKIEADLSRAQTGQKIVNPESLLAYQNPESAAAPVTAGDDEFTFADLVDMVNPLQHIPIVSHIYREVTGDTIKPASAVVGGALFGGAIGAAAELVNVVIEHETGEDIVGNAIAMVLPEKKPDTAPEIMLAQNETETAATDDHALQALLDAPVQNHPENPVIAEEEKPEEQLTRALQTAQNRQPSPHSAAAVAAQDSFPGALLSFSDLGYDPAISISRSRAANGRTAGAIHSVRTQAGQPYPQAPGSLAQEPITQVSLSPLPGWKRRN